MPRLDRELSELDRRLEDELDGLNPLLIGAEPLPDPKSGALLWFKHPKYENVFCKVGPTREGRILGVWLRLTDERDVFVLAVWKPHKKDLEHMKALQRRHDAH